MLTNNLQSKRRGSGEVGVVIVLAIVGFLAFTLFKPEAIRTPLQVPVSVTIRGSLVGIGNVVQVRNSSGMTLREVVVIGRNSGTNSAAKHRIGTINPGQVAEVGWMEWNWRVDPGETISVSADGFLPIVFSAAQIGVR